MPAITSALVVGGGAAGCATAILLAQAGVAVDLVEVRPDIARIGSGITLQGSALRVLRQLGVWDRVRESGYSFDTLGFRAPDPDATLVVEMQDTRTGGADLPATCGAVRPVLAQILLDRAAEVGAKVHMGTSVQRLTADDDGVDVELSDGQQRRYELVVGADGVHSRTRQQIGVVADVRPTGMGIWRVFGPRPESVTRTDLIYGGPSYIAGFCPTSQDTLYAYLVEDAQDRSTLSPQEQLDTMRELTRPYGGPWNEIRDGLTDPDRVNYTHFASHLLDGPWHRGRVVLVGDAAHSCPPTLALGAAMALEDAAVLGELLIDADGPLEPALFDTYLARRRPRVELVVSSSVQLAQWQLDHDPAADVEDLMRRVTTAVSSPA